ncbi:6836_t:CDS:2 [Gigaspora margarita]|uniref:6836_t:CDS:1 n=1 Tax=Gigaspora margarita TaxID=4874 RepID=A0ABM8W513_GIGMA|nr:6836_t:CDS:2 [Gigaspora margarita]
MKGINLLDLNILLTVNVQSINTPGPRVAVGATIPITWAYTPQANALPGTLSVIDSVTQSRTTISTTIVLSSKNYQWKVNVPPGSYYLALNDGAGDKLSGTFSVFDANSGTAPTGTSGSTPSGPTNSLGSSNSSSSSGSSSSPGSTKSNVAP